MKLYELTSNYKNLEELLDNPEIPQEMILEALNEVQDNIEEKAVNIAKFIKNVATEADGLKAEEKRLSERRKSLENRADNLKEYLYGQLKLVGLNKLKTPLFSFGIQNNPPSVNVLDEAKIDESYFVVKKELNKKAVLEALKSGQVVEGAEIKQGESLRIR